MTQPQLRGLRDRQLLEVCAGLRPDPDRAGDPSIAAKIALRSLARRHQVLTEEIDDLDALLAPRVADINPGLLAVNGVGVEVAG